MRSKGGASITSTLEARAETGRHYNAVVEFRRQSRACFPHSRHVRIVKERIDRFATALPRLAVARERHVTMIMADTVDSPPLF